MTTGNIRTDNPRDPQVPVTVLRGLPTGADAELTDTVTAAVAAALTVVAAEASPTSAHYSDPRAALRRHPRGSWGVPGRDTRWQTVFSPAGFRG